MKTIVYLVGAGPGDPGLITQKALTLISNANAIVYDYLSNPTLLKNAKASCILVNAGKRLGFKAMSQDQINKKLVSLAKKGIGPVVRLKGGDPLLFGRGGEEAEYLEKNRIKFEIVPGVTSAIAVPAYAGIPITHRDITSTVSLVTGHEDPLKNKSSIDWPGLAKSKSIVFLMGTKNLRSNIENLIANGMSKKTPIAAIQWGTYARQKTVIGNLENIDEKIKKGNIKSPSIIVIGEVCKLRSKINWFENKPLFGKKIVVTRARKDASNLVNKIFENGGEAIEIPTIEIKPLKTKSTLDTIKKINDYDWIIFTSVNGVSQFFKNFFSEFDDIRSLGNIKIAAIGSETARNINSYGLKVNLVPRKFIAEALVSEFKTRKISNQKILIPRAKGSREILVDELKSLGNKIKELKIYESIAPKSNIKRDINAQIIKNNIYGITFTSSSTVHNFFKYVSPNSLNKEKQIKFFCIGPITAQTLINYGFKATKIAKKFTIENLLKEIIN